MTGGAAIDVVAVAFPLKTLDDRVPPTNRVYVASDCALDAVVFKELVPEIALVRVEVAIALPSKSEGTVAAGASPPERLAVVPVIVMISTDELSNCAIARFVSHSRRSNDPIIISSTDVPFYLLMYVHMRTRGVEKNRPWPFDEEVLENRQGFAKQCTRYWCVSPKPTYATLATRGVRLLRKLSTRKRKSVKAKAGGLDYRRVETSLPNDKPEHVGHQTSTHGG